MAKDSKIEWTHHTFNPWWGCERVSAACKNCYAEAWAHRLGLELWGEGAPRRAMSDAYWRQPLAWNRAAAIAGRRDRVFCASMADVFENRDDLTEPRRRLWRLIADTPNLDWLLLTKRPQHVGVLAPWRDLWPHNVWLGTTVENQRWAQKRIPLLLEQPATVLFLSCEPLLGPINLVPWLAAPNGARTVNWVITGGESGHRSRPMNPDWARGLRDQCEACSVPFLFKQWGNWLPGDGSVNGHQMRQLPSEQGVPMQMINVGKKAAGRNLDGRKWDGVPYAA
jgi:protein gp37